MNNILLLGIPSDWIYLIIFIYLIPGILWLWALIDLVKSEFSDKNMKLVWALIIIFIPFIGSIIYLILGRKQKLPSSQ
ncbi:MAG: PLD nuclease N-terminal domain-containing protein [Fulvivirga sp.]